MCPCIATHTLSAVLLFLLLCVARPPNRLSKVKKSVSLQKVLLSQLKGQSLCGLQKRIRATCKKVCMFEKVKQFKVRILSLTCEKCM